MPNDRCEPWSVVVLGRWNRAILTPLWIGKNLLGLKEGDELRIQVPMDAIGPLRVAQGPLAVLASDSRLLVEATDGGWASLGLAVQAALRAMEELPRTPVSAAGINVNHACATKAEAQSVDRLWSLDLDTQLERLGLPILDRMAVRRVEWRSGCLSFRITQSDEQEDVSHGCSFNFERRSPCMDDLRQWLSTPVAEMRQTVERVIEAVLGSDTHEP